MRSSIVLVFLVNIQLITISQPVINWDIEKYAPDMILIPGNDSTPSFYISRYEVRNRDYMIYLEWLKRTYQSFPEVYEAALPDTVKHPNYLFNPSFRNFPVVGVSYKQANDYCQWLTDRFNEYSMIKNGLLNSDFDQINERSFNTLSYLEEQYTGLVRRELLSTHSSSGGRSPIWYDKLMIPSFRLASIDEWNHLVETIENNEEMLDFKQLSCKRPYGRRYFLDLFYEKYFENDDWAGEHTMQFHDEATESEIYANTIYPVCKENSLSIFLGIDNNVSEWVANSYTQEITNSEDLALDVISIEKDHLGRAPYIILKDDELGRPVYVDRNLPKTSFSLLDSDSSYTGFRVALSGLNKPSIQTFFNLKKALKSPDEVMVLYFIKFYPELSIDLSIFKNIVDFSMAHNRLKTAPIGLDKALSLQKCRLPYNEFESIPAEIFELRNLQFLDLSYNKINAIPCDITRLENLVYLKLTNNRITHVPEELCQLKNLENIDLSNNELQSLPDSFSQLSKLKRLDLSGNDIYDVTDIITSLPNLEYLSIGDNNLTEQEKDMMIKWITARGGVLRYGNELFYSYENSIYYRLISD